VEIVEKIKVIRRGKKVRDACNAYDRTLFYLPGVEYAEEDDDQLGHSSRRLTCAMQDRIITRYMHELLSEVVLEFRDFRLDKALSDRNGAR